MKKRVRIYKAGGNTGKYYNKTAQFLQRADEGMEIRSEESDMNMHDRVLTFIQKSLQEGQLNRDEIAKTILDQNLGYEEEIVNKMIDDVAMSLQQQMMQQQQQAMLAQQQPQMQSQEEMMPEEEMETDEMQENYSRLGGQKKPSRKKFIKDYLKKAQEGLEQQVSSTNDTPLDGRETFKNNFIKGIQESVLKDQANKQFDLQNNMFAEGGDSNEDISVPPVGAENGWAHSMHDYGEALSHMMPENTLTTARNGRQVSRDMRRINRDFQKMFGNMAVGYGNPGAMLPYGVSVINPLMNSGAFNIPEDKTTGNEKGELINLPNMKVRAKRGWLGRLKEWEADINFGAIPANMMYGMQTGYPFQMSSYSQSFSPGVVTTRKVAKAINNETIKEVANTTNSEAANNASISPAEKARQEAEKARQERLTEQSKDWMYEGARKFGILNSESSPVQTKNYSELLNYLYPDGPFQETANEGWENDPESFNKYKKLQHNPFVKRSGTVDDPNTYLYENLVYSGPLSQNELNAKINILEEVYHKYEKMPEGPAAKKALKEYLDLEQELGYPYNQQSYITTDDEGNEYSSQKIIEQPNPKAAEMARNYYDMSSHAGFGNRDWIYENRNLLFKQKGGTASIAKMQPGGTATPNYMKSSADYKELLNTLKSERDQTGYGSPRWAELERLIPYYEDSLYNAEAQEMVPQQIKDQQAGKSAYQRFEGKNLDPIGNLKGALSSYRDQLKMVRNIPNDNLYPYGNPYFLEDAGYYLLEGADWLNENLNKVNDYFDWSTFGFETGGQISQQDPNYGNPDLYKFVYGGIDPDGYPMVKDVNDPYFRNGGLYKYQGEQNSQVSANNSYENYIKQLGDKSNMSLRENLTAKELYDLQKQSGMFNTQKNQTQTNVTSGQGFQPGQYYPGNMGNFIPNYGRPNYGREIAGSILGAPLGMLGARRNKLFTPDFNYWTQTGVPTVGGMPYYGQLDPTKISNIHTESKGRGLFRRPSTTMDINFNVPAGSTRPKLYTDASGNIKNANPMFSPNVGTTEKKEMSPMESVIQRETEGMSGKDLKTRTRDIKRAFKKGYGSDYMEDDSRNSTTYTQGTPPASSNNISGYTPNASGPGNSGYNADSDGNGIPDYLEVKNESETLESSVNWQQSLPNANYLEQAKNNPFAGNPDLQRFTEEQATPNQLNIQSGTPGFDLPASRQAPPAEFNISEGDAFEQRQLDKGLVWNEAMRKWVPNEENMNVLNQAIDVMDPSYRSSQSDTRYIGGLPDDFNQVNQEVIPTNQEVTPVIQESTPFSFPNQSYLESGIQIPDEAGMDATDQIPYMEEPVGPVAPDYFSPQANEGFTPYFINSPVNRQQGAMQQRSGSPGGNLQRPRQTTIQQRPTQIRNINNSNSNYERPASGPVSQQVAAEQARIRNARKNNPEVAKLDYQVVQLNSKIENLRAQENALLYKKNKTAADKVRLQQINTEANELTIQLSNLENQLRAKVNTKKLGGLAKFQGTQNSQVQTGFSKQTGMKCPMGAVKDPVTGFCKDISTGQMVQPISSLSVPSVDELTKNPFTNTASNPYKNPLTGESAAITNTNDGYKYTGEDLVDMGLPDDVAKARFKMNTAGTLNTYDLASNIFNLGMPMASNLLTTARNQRMEDTYEGRQLGRTTYRDKRGQYSGLTGRDALRPQEEGEIIVGQNAKYGGSRYKQGGVYNMSKQELMAFMAAGGQIEFL
jgi:hypothetical protein